MPNDEIIRIGELLWDDLPAEPSPDGAVQRRLSPAHLGVLLQPRILPTQPPIFFIERAPWLRRHHCR